MYVGSWKIDDLLTFTVNTHTTAGAESDADSAPTYRVYEDETGTPILTGTMALLDDSNTVGQYSEQITLSAANGFENGKSYNIRIRGVVGGTAGVTIRSFQVGSVQQQTQAALVENNLDHLAKTATGSSDMTSEVADNTILSRILANGDTSAFDPSTDGLQPIRDRGDAAWVTATSVTVSDKTGFKLASDGLALVTSWTVDVTGSLSGSVGSVTTKTGFKLASDGLDLVVPADPSAIPVLGTASVVTWIGYFGAWSKCDVESEADEVRLKNQAGTLLATHAQSDDGTTFHSDDAA